ncbi:MAG: DUF3035 domain-containing protein [Pseudomonadota bacterium]
MSIASRRNLMILGAIAVFANGCAALGGGKNPPDEFAITTKAPLTTPPDYALRPPKPGESRPQELSSSERAQQVLLGDPNAAPPSVGEQALLQRAKALQADPNIRSILGAEGGGRAEKDRSLANQLIFWRFINGDVDDSAAPLRVEDPEAWFAAREKAIQAVTGTEEKVSIKKDDRTLGLPGIF